MVELNSHNHGIIICIDKYENEHCSGRIYAQFLTEPLLFADMSHLILRIDDLVDARNYPQAFTRARSFTPSQMPSHIHLSDKETLSEEQIAALHGEISTALLLIISRRSSTWQGLLDWQDGQPPAEFNSALEMIRLIAAHID